MALQACWRITTRTDTRRTEGPYKDAQVQGSTVCTMTSSSFSLTAVEDDTYIAFKERLHVGHRLCSHHAHGFIP